MTEKPSWRELEAKFREQSLGFLILALSFYVGLVIGVFFYDLLSPVTVVLILGSGVSQVLALYTTFQERKCRYHAESEERAARGDQR